MKIISKVILVVLISKMTNAGITIPFLWGNPLDLLKAPFKVDIELRNPWTSNTDHFKIEVADKAVGRSNNFEESNPNIPLMTYGTNEELHNPAVKAEEPPKVDLGSNIFHTTKCDNLLDREKDILDYFEHFLDTDTTTVPEDEEMTTEYDVGNRIDISNTIAASLLGKK